MLSAVIFLPLVFAVALTFINDKKLIRILAFAGATLEFALCLGLLSRFSPDLAGLQLVEKKIWVQSAGINYFLGVDGISIWLVVLTAFLTPITILGSWKSINDKVKGFHICLLVLESAMLGSFLAIDAILFYVFFEASLIPMYFIVGIWGGANRIYATIKFFIYTMVGSLFMLLAIISLMYMTRALPEGQMSASLLDFYRLNLPFIAGDFLSTQTLLFFAFALAFAIKVPMFPFHTWLPDAHVQALQPQGRIHDPCWVSCLKMGTYGLYEVCCCPCFLKPY